MATKAGIWHEVEQGDSTTSLAHMHGLFWETVWLHPSNTDLRRQRDKHNILMPGDRIFIPGRREKAESRSTEARHRFVRKGIPERLNVRFLDPDGKPYANVPFVLTIDGKSMSGELDFDGWLHQSVAPNARRAHIEVGKHGELVACDLALGYMDPVDMLTGVQARLQNLGFFGGAIDGRESTELRNAVLQFRRHEGLPESTDIDDELRSRLEGRHRS